jgi:hypothetical protein
MNSRLRIAFAATSILFLTVWSLPAHAEGNMTVKTGYLTCHEASGWGFGYLKSAVILWAVAAPTNDLKTGALAGHYGGATASVSLGVGAGANVLLGGFKDSIALQPVSVEGQNGLNVAAGVAAMTLTYRGSKAPH